MKAAPTIAEERIPLSQKYAELLRVQKEVDASNRLYPTTRTGFFKVLSVDGEPIGYGFYCPRCRLSACGLNENSVVRHCGKESRFPTGLFGWLTKLGLRSYTLERRWF